MSDDGTPYTDAFSFISPESRNEANTDHDKENTEETSEGAAKDSEQANQTYTLRPRDRKMTPKGLDWQVDKICSDFKLHVSRWRKCASSIEILISDSSDTKHIRRERDILMNIMTTLSEIYDRLKQTLTNEEDVKYRDLLDQYQGRLEITSGDNHTLMRDISNCLRELECDSVSRASSRSHNSRTSRSSRHSNTSRGSRESIDTVIEAAALKTKLKYIDTEAKHKADLERIRVQKELDIAQAKLEALETLEDTGPFLYSDFKHSVPELDSKEHVKRFIDTQVRPEEDKAKIEPVSQAPPILHRNLMLPTFTSPQTQQENVATSNASRVPLSNVDLQSLSNPTPPSSGLRPTEQGLLDLATSLAKQVSLGRLPPPEPTIFLGDPLKYPSWKASFQTLIEQRQIPASERIHYLKKYLGGSVKDVVENYFLLSTDDAYEEAKGLLEQRYGNAFVVANAFRDKLEKWPKVGPRDGVGLQRFGDFLKQCYTAMQSIGSLNILNDERENRRLLSKLPDWLVTRWGRIATQYKEERMEFPPFKNFMDFIVKEAKIATDPITSIESVKKSELAHTEPSKPRPDFKARQRGTADYGKRSFLTDVDEDQVANVNVANRSDRRRNCVLCEGNHELDDCKQFLTKSLEGRKQYAKQKGLCFGCLHAGHLSRKCRQRKRCRTCSKFHPSSLHGDVYQRGQHQMVEDIKTVVSKESSSGTTLMNHSGASSKSTMILPVYVSHKENPDRERLVYALLDTQSDTTFILDKTSKALGLEGKPVKLMLSTMYAENKAVDSCKIGGLLVRGFNSEHRIPLPETYTREIMPANRSHIPTPEIARRWPHLEVIADELLPLADCEVGLLIGYNCVKALTPRDVIVPSVDGPYGQRTDLGWSVIGIVENDCSTEWDEDPIGISHRIVACDVPTELCRSEVSRPDHVVFSLRNKIKEVINPEEVVRMLEVDFSENSNSSKHISYEDRKFLDAMEKGIHKLDGHYEMPLPFREAMPYLSNNRDMALQRLQHLRNRFAKDAQYCEHYISFMRELILKGFAERVPEKEINVDSGQAWYIPHHGVYHPQKPGKLRVVFDCSAKYMGQSLNDHLLQGPDMMNMLVGVLCRFRKEPVAFVCDIEQMFHQFKVNVEHRNYLRFLWWDDGNFSKDPTTYRMTVHLFGAVSSPGCANFGLRQAATDGELQFGSDVANFIKRDFYVDDGLKSVATPEEAISLIERSKELCCGSGLRLHKFLSNSKEVLESISADDRAKGLAGIDIHQDKLPIERTLGIQWCIQTDAFQFKITPKDRPLTRRGVLSTLSSVYDPLGFIAPFVLVGKQILQEMCRNQTDWDSPLPENLRPRWRCWREDLEKLGSLEIKRCLKPENFGDVVVAELHHFSDASTIGYGQCSYLRLIDDKQQVHCSLVMAKSRVTPLKQVTVPRLELTAALVSVKVSSQLLEELEISNVVEWFWTDSTVVLGYIANDSRRFHVFVANRLQQIRDRTEPYQWNYISSAENPADIASRGITAAELRNRKEWFRGPNFLWESSLPFSGQPVSKPSISEDDPEVKRCQVFETKVEPTEYTSLIDYLERCSDWNRAKRLIANCLKFKTLLRKIPCQKATDAVPSKEQGLPVALLEEAELAIVRLVQKEAFSEELKILNNTKGCEDVNRKKSVRKTSSLYRLDPFLDNNDVLRVGGRLQKGEFTSYVKHPIILPRKSHVTRLIIRHFHERSRHQGRSITTNEIRSNGYWIIGCSSAVYSLISRCVKCRKRRSQTLDQKMSDLPADRLAAEAPFTYSGVDFFGPFYIKEGRKELKRYGVLFTCMSSRAVHLETANSLDTSSFINALRRFLSIRGPVKQLRSDRGTNFVGAERELRESLEELDDSRLKQFLTAEGCDYISFKMNIPSASHMGGVWERQIRTVRNVLSSLLQDFGSQLDDEGLRTLFCEAMAIVNSRPLTISNLHDPFAPEPITPNHLLTMKSKVVLPPPGEFQTPDLYCRRRWRRIQYLANEFWTRWRKEYVQILQTRTKWSSTRRNIQIGDVVIVKDDNLPRNQWHLGRVIDTYASEDGLVRSVRLAIGDSNLDKKGKRNGQLSTLERPIHKLVLLLENETGEDPTEEPY